MLGWVWLTAFLMASGTARTYSLTPAMRIAIATAGRSAEIDCRWCMPWLK